MNLVDTAAWFAAVGAERLTDGVTAAAFPMHTALGEAAADCLRLAGGRVALGAQDVSAHGEGAYTGEVSARSIVKYGAAYALAGHSERRALHGETDETVAAKVRAALGAGLTPVLCVGETKDERERGAAEAVVSRQVSAVYATLPEPERGRVIVAYEPVWAIGTGLTASPDDAERMCALIKSLTSGSVPREAGGRAAASELERPANSLRPSGSVPREADGRAAASELERQANSFRPSGSIVLYGGSMNEKNAAELLGKPSIDGGLIGGASLAAEKFIEIIRIAGRLANA
jgi:triosephosphate isomerase